MLVQYRDGELDSSQSWAVEQHLIDCWECTGKLHELEHAITWLVEAECVRVQPPPQAPALWRLRRCMAAHRAELTAQPRSWSGFRRSAPMLGLAVLAVVIGALALLATDSGWLMPRLSATELVARATDAERARILRPGRIVYQEMLFEQVGLQQSTTLPDGTYRIARWWDNTRLPRRMVYRLRDSEGRLMSGSWFLADGSHVRFERYTSSGQPLLVHEPSRAAVKAYIESLPEPRRSRLLGLPSTAEQDALVLERVAAARWLQFAMGIRTGRRTGRIEAGQSDGRSVYRVTADRFDEDLGSFKWTAVIDADSYRPLESVARPDGAEGAFRRWKELALSDFGPGEYPAEAFEVDAPHEAATRIVTVTERVAQLESRIGSQ